MTFDEFFQYIFNKDFMKNDVIILNNNMEYKNIYDIILKEQEEEKKNKFPNEKTQIPDNEIEIDDEPLNEGEILFPEEKQTNNTMSDIQQEEIENNIPMKKSEKKERKIRLNKRINDENKSKEDEEIFKKEK